MVTKVGRDITAAERWARGNASYLEAVGGEYHRHRLAVMQRLVDGAGVKGRRAVDFGCGEGTFIEGLLDQGADFAHGIDVNEEMLARARERLATRENVTLDQGSVEALKTIESNSVDLFTALSVTGYLSDDEDDAFYRQLIRVLRPGGAAVVSHSNLLFDLFTFNKFTVATLSEQLVGPDHETELGSLLTHPGAPDRMSFNIRENPLAYRYKVERYGLVERQQEFANFHPLPPLLMDQNAFVDIDARAYRDTLDWPEEERWRLMFQCSMFGSRLEKAV